MGDQEVNGASDNSRLERLKREKESIDPECVETLAMLEKEIENELCGHDKSSYIEIHQTQPTRMEFRVKMPVKEYPQANFVGKLLGPGGSTITQLSNQTGVRLAIHGKGSVRDKAKQEELRKKGGKYAHLNTDLHVFIETQGANGAECYKKLGSALTAIKEVLFEDEGGMGDGMMHPGMMAPPLSGVRPLGPGRGGLMGPRGPVPSLMPGRPPMGPASLMGRGAMAARGGAMRGAAPPARGMPGKMGGSLMGAGGAMDYENYGEEYYDESGYEDGSAEMGGYGEIPSLAGPIRGGFMQNRGGRGRAGAPANQAANRGARGATMGASPRGARGGATLTRGRGAPGAPSRGRGAAPGGGRGGVRGAQAAGARGRGQKRPGSDGTGWGAPNSKKANPGSLADMSYDDYSTDFSVDFANNAQGW